MTLFISATSMLEGFKISAISSVLRTNHPIESLSPFMWDLLRMYKVLDLVTLLFSTEARLPIPTMGERNERLGKRNHGNYWISWMIGSSMVGLCWYPYYVWSNPAYSQSDTRMSVTTHKVSITLLRWRPVPRFDYGVSMLRALSRTPSAFAVRLDRRTMLINSTAEIHG